MGRGGDGQGFTVVDSRVRLLTDREREFLGAGGCGTIARWETHTAGAARDGEQQADHADNGMRRSFTASALTRVYSWVILVFVGWRYIFITG